MLADASSAPSVVVKAQSRLEGWRFALLVVSALRPLLGGRLMAERTVTIVNKVGLHARPAAEIVKLASQFKSDITLSRDDLEVNGKSIMGVMMLAAEYGTSLLLRAEGDDAEQALDALAQLIADGFGERLMDRVPHRNPRLRRASPSAPSHLLRWEVPDVPHRIDPRGPGAGRDRAASTPRVDRAKDRLNQVRARVEAAAGRGGGGDLRRPASRSSRTPTCWRGVEEFIRQNLGRREGVRSRDARMAAALRAALRAPCCASASAT